MLEPGTPAGGLAESGESASGVSEPYASQPVSAALRKAFVIPAHRNRLLFAAAAAGAVLAATLIVAQPAALAATHRSASATPSSSPSPSSSSSPSKSTPVAVAFGGTAAVGGLFTVKRGKLVHFCTAAVVSSPRGDLAITAAHCVQGRRLGSRSTVTFAPGYHDGKFPYGQWLVRSEFVDENWKRYQDANDDFAFLLVGRARRRIQRSTGGETLEINVPLPKDAEVIGYPDATNLPVKCDGVADRLHLKGYRQMIFDCDGLTNGTSGGPFLMNVSSKTGRGGVFGVIGGYQQGGDTSSVSYSALFQRNMADLFKQASA